MSGGHDKFTICEIIYLLDEKYGIPFDGEGSDISSEHSESDIDAEEADFDREFAESYHDFSKTTWKLEKKSDYEG
jgi:hypothetical protein